MAWAQASRQCGAKASAPRRRCEHPYRRASRWLRSKIATRCTKRTSSCWCLDIRGLYGAAGLVLSCLALAKFFFLYRSPLSASRCLSRTLPCRGITTSESRSDKKRPCREVQICSVLFQEPSQSCPFDCSLRFTPTRMSRIRLFSCIQPVDPPSLETSTAPRGLRLTKSFRRSRNTRNGQVRALGGRTFPTR